MNNANKIIAGALAFALGAGVAVGVTQIIDHREDIKNKYNEVKEQITHKQELDDANAQIETLNEEKAEAEEALATSRARIGELERVVTQKTTALTQANATIAEQLATITAQATQIDNLTAFKFGKYINIENDTVIEILNNGKVKLYEDAENFELLDYTVENNIITVEVDNEEMQFEITSNMSVENTVGEDTYTFVYLTEELEDAINSRNLLQSDLATAQAQIDNLTSRISQLEAQLQTVQANLDNATITYMGISTSLQSNDIGISLTKDCVYNGSAIKQIDTFNFCFEQEFYNVTVNNYNTSFYANPTFYRTVRDIMQLHLPAFNNYDFRTTVSFYDLNDNEIVLNDNNDYKIVNFTYEFYSDTEVDNLILNTLSQEDYNVLSDIEWQDGSIHKFNEENSNTVIKSVRITLQDLTQNQGE